MVVDDEVNENVILVMLSSWAIRKRLQDKVYYCTLLEAVLKGWGWVCCG